MKRIYIKARRPSFGTQFLTCVLSAFGAVSLTLLIALPIAKIDPAHAFGPTKVLVGVVLMLTVWPLAVGLWLSVDGWLLFAVLGKMWRFRFSFVCDNTETIGDAREKAPNQATELMTTTVTPPAGAGGRASGAPGSS